MAASESNTKLLEELEELSQTLYQSHITATRRTASLVLPRSSAPSIPTADEADTATNEDSKPSVRPRSRRMSLSPWRSRAKEENEQQKKEKESDVKLFDHEDTPSADKKGIWKWKPMRALSHIGMQKLSCLFSVEVVTAQGLPASMNGLRLSVCVRKKETKDGAVNTMPSRVSQGAADFEETLFVKCHVYWAQVGDKQQLKFEPRPFLIYLFAIDAAELDFGRSSVDLSRLIQDSLEKNAEGSRIRQWDTSFDLSGKAKGGQLLLKLAFQIMEKDGGTGLFSQLEGGLKPGKAKASSTFGRKQSKSSFSIPSPKLSSRSEVWTPSRTGTTADFQGIDDLNLDEPAPEPEPQKPKEEESGIEEVDLPDFEVVDKGVEIQNTGTNEDEELTEKAENGSSTSEVVKEVVHDHVHLTRLTELDSIAQQIKALESMMGEENADQFNDNEEETYDAEKLDADEENVTMEFLQMLEDEEAVYDYKQLQNKMPTASKTKETADDAESISVFLPDLGKGLGCVVQTRNGGFLTATNPFNIEVSKTDTPKLAMQISRPFVITSDKSVNGFEIFQRMAASGVEQLSSEVLSLMPIEELMGKTAEQVAFEGIASTIISGRKKEGASSSAARTLATIKQIASALGTGRKERITTGLWNVNEDPLTADEILAFSMQKIEAMAIDALKIQAEIAEEEAPFEVSPLGGKALISGQKDQNHPLASAVPLDDWMKDNKLEESETITLLMVVQLRDPLRRYEAVGGPAIVLIHATPEAKQEKNEQIKFRVASLHVGGMKVQTGQKKSAWDTEKQRLTAIQWLIAYNMGKAAKKGKSPSSKGQDLLWSISSRIVADMWLKSIRNPDVKFTK
ncbi:protein PLASTID MOVEMENT IMPAIRED 1-like [Chenopodium quinoa]|uniref:protein PLASTID MOVEMENT IMPAIRED 1-like n=1 Tax=Chenopodium quinoa TaxID=63459 RepID=UPI000B76D3D0|nr:protein PLASTID MOVEMENT IMPAIRED 1-like [Chenopodium quinoa]